MTLPFMTTEELEFSLRSHRDSLRERRYTLK